MDDLAGRLANRVQLTMDGTRLYLDAVEGAFGIDVDYAQLVKLYGESPGAQKRYSPAECTREMKSGPTPTVIVRRSRFPDMVSPFATARYCRAMQLLGP